MLALRSLWIFHKIDDGETGDWSIFLSKRYPTVEQRCRIIQGKKYVPIPSEDEILKLVIAQLLSKAFESNVQDEDAVQDASPTGNFSSPHDKKGLWNFNQVSAGYYPILALQVPEKTSYIQDQFNKNKEEYPQELRLYEEQEKSHADFSCPAENLKISEGNFHCLYPVIYLVENDFCLLSILLGKSLSCESLIESGHSKGKIEDEEAFYHPEFTAAFELLREIYAQLKAFMLIHSDAVCLREMHVYLRFAMPFGRPIITDKSSILAFQHSLKTQSGDYCFSSVTDSDSSDDEHSSETLEGYPKESFLGIQEILSTWDRISDYVRKDISSSEVEKQLVSISDQEKAGEIHHFDLKEPVTVNSAIQSSYAAAKALESNVSHDINYPLKYNLAQEEQRIIEPLEPPKIADSPCEFLSILDAHLSSPKKTFSLESKHEGDSSELNSEKNPPLKGLSLYEPVLPIKEAFMAQIFKFYNRLAYKECRNFESSWGCEAMRRFDDAGRGSIISTEMDDSCDITSQREGKDASLIGQEKRNKSSSSLYLNIVESLHYSSYGDGTPEEVFLQGNIYCFSGIESASAILVPFKIYTDDSIQTDISAHPSARLSNRLQDPIPSVSSKAKYLVSCNIPSLPFCLVKYSFFSLPFMPVTAIEIKLEILIHPAVAPGLTKLAVRLPFGDDEGRNLLEKNVKCSQGTITQDEKKAALIWTLPRKIIPTQLFQKGNSNDAFKAFLSGRINFKRIPEFITSSIWRKGTSLSSDSADQASLSDAENTRIPAEVYFCTSNSTLSGAEIDEESIKVSSTGNTVDKLYIRVQKDVLSGKYRLWSRSI